MRAVALALIALASFACRRGELQQDAAGPGMIGFDGGMAGGGGTGGSAAGGPGGAGATDAASGTDVRLPNADANCGMAGIAGGRVPTDILIVLDRAIALSPDRWNSFVSAIVPTITANNAYVDWGVYAFPQDGPACGAGTVTRAIDVSIAPDDATHVVAHMVAAGTGASGTPIAAAIDVARRYMLSLNDPNPKVLLLVTDGRPTCAGRVDPTDPTDPTDPMSADPAQALTDAQAAITEAYLAGIPTFVLAPSTTTGDDLVALNALARAGGYARQPGPDGIVFETDKTFYFGCRSPP